MQEILTLQESLGSLQRSLQQQDRQVQSVNVELKQLQSNRPTNTVTDSQFQQVIACLMLPLSYSGTITVYVCTLGPLFSWEL